MSDWNRIRKRGWENFTWDRGEGESEGESEDRCRDESEHERPLARPPIFLDRPWPFCSRKNGRDSSRDISHTQFVWGPYFPPSVVPIEHESKPVPVTKPVPPKKTVLPHSKISTLLGCVHCKRFILKKILIYVLIILFKETHSFNLIFLAIFYKKL